MSKVNFIPGQWAQGYIMHQQRMLLLGPQPLLLDDYPGAAAAYSLRKLRTDYTGSAIRVRESATNTEADIGFNADGTLNTTALLAHVGANNGFVTTWYDQSGNARNATQSTLLNQPQIVSSGSVILQNLKPSLLTDSTDELSTSSTVSQAGFFFAVLADSGVNGFQGLTDQLVVTDNSSPVNWSLRRTADVTIAADTTINSNAQAVLSFRTIQNQCSIWVNGTQSATDTSTNAFASTTLRLFSGGATRFTGYAQEIILYSSDQSANRTAIESNINAYYNIY